MDCKHVKGHLNGRSANKLSLTLFAEGKHTTSKADLTRLNSWRRWGNLFLGKMADIKWWLKEFLTENKDFVQFSSPYKRLMFEFLNKTIKQEIQKGGMAQTKWRF